MQRDKDDDDDIATPDTSRSNSVSEDEDPDRRTSPPPSTDQSNEVRSSSPSNLPSNDRNDSETNKGQSFLSSSSSESENDFAMVNQNDYPNLQASTLDANDAVNSISTTDEQPAQPWNPPAESASDDEQIPDRTHQQERDSSDDDDDDNDNTINTRESLFNDQSRPTPFEAFASDQPLKNERIDSISADLDQEFDQEPNMQQTVTAPWTSEINLDDEPPVQQSTGDEEPPWELDESDDEKAQTINPTSQTNFFPDTQKAVLAVRQTSSSISTSDSDGDADRHQTKAKEPENYDDYFTSAQAPTEETTSASAPSPKNVRFDENIEQVNVLTPKDSLDNSEATSTSDSDEEEADPDHELGNGFPTISDRISDHMNGESILHQPAVSKVETRSMQQRPENEIALDDSDDLPPPLPSLPPLHGKKSTSIESIPSKSTISETKSKAPVRSDTDVTPTITTNPMAAAAASVPAPITTTETKLFASTNESSFGRSYDSAILRPTSVDRSESVDPEDLQDVISCLIDNNQINIDGKTISPFKCVIGSAGRLNEDNQTAVIAIYGCWLPDHRLREYRYIMDQLFYYVYHKIEKIVTDDYILVYFHGATPKHRTPDLKFLRKCYQMINFRLRKNLRAVYVVHPTRWLRTIIALSRPFFSNKFYHKVHYLYTISELERQFPRNQFSIPVIIEQTDWLYSQKYDRQNASIKRSIERSVVRSTNSLAQESTA